MAGKKVDTTLPKDVSDEYVAQWSTLPLCTGCERPIRPAFSKVRDWPATVAYGAGTRCKSCYNRSYLAAKAVGGAAANVRAVKARHRGSVTDRYVVDYPRSEVAATWSAEERSAAVKVCDQLGDASQAADVLEMLGLFEIDRRVPLGEGLGNFRTPKGVAAGKLKA